MALSQSDIENYCDEGWLCNDYPERLCDDEHHNPHKLIVSQREPDLSGNAVRLHIGEVFNPAESYSNSALSLFSGPLGDFNARRETDGERSPPTEGAVQIPPGKFVYFLTEERVNLPFDVCGQLFMNPRISNKGILFFTTGHIAPGWMGRLTGTLLNMTDKTVYLNRTDHVLYLTLFETGERTIREDNNGESDPYSAHWSHTDPQLTIEDARGGELTQPDPGFARTTQFVTKRDLYQIAIIAIGALSVIVTLLVFGLNSVFS